MGENRSAFVAYHRARRIRVGLTALSWLSVTAAVVAAFVMVEAASPGPVEASVVAASASPVPPRADASALSPTSAEVPATHASVPNAVLAGQAPSPTAVVSPNNGPRTFRIVITAVGYQAELDACQWVRMDLVDTMPFVGAHTSCGGRVVLTMKPGDRVMLVGQGLDGRYRVAEARDAHAGDLAAAAVDGMTASVVLQTCYPGTGGKERLVGLQLAP